MSLGTVAATDPESATLAYSLVGDSGSFEIDATTGEVFYTGSGEDYESGTTSFSLTVRASDGSHTVDTTVTINVTDVDEPVEVTEDTGSTTDTDAARAGATDLGDITDLQGPRFPLGTVDGDADQVDYLPVHADGGERGRVGAAPAGCERRLVPRGCGRQTCSTEAQNSGTTNEAIAETLLAGTYYLRVESQEAGVNAHVVRYGVSAPDADALAELLQQSVTAVNAAPTFGQQGYTFSLAENTDGSTNRVSLGTVAATDPEGATLAYSLVGDAGSFEIDETTGELFYTGSGEDFESDTTSYSLTVRASDGSETVDTNVTVTVSNVNESPTFGQQGYTFSLAENTDGSTNRVSLGTVAATDPEGATLAYSLVGDSGSFEIDETSGELFYTGSGEDYETDTTRFTLTVRASDGSETADTTVTVNVTDVEETVLEPLTSVSEPGGSDLPEDTSTTGRVAVDGTAAGEIQRANDRDWFSVELEAGKTYQIDLSGVRSGGGTLSLPHLRGVYDADGSQIPGIYNPLAFSFANPHNRLGEGISVDVQVFPGEDSKAFFAPDEDGTYYPGGG